jgi:hypothetical protein
MKIRGSVTSNENGKSQIICQAVAGELCVFFVAVVQRHAAALIATVFRALVAPPRAGFRTFLHWRAHCANADFAAHARPRKALQLAR